MHSLIDITSFTAWVFPLWLHTLPTIIGFRFSHIYIINQQVPLLSDLQCLVVLSISWNDHHSDSLLAAFILEWLLDQKAQQFFLVNKCKQVVEDLDWVCVQRFNVWGKNWVVLDLLWLGLGCFGTWNETQDVRCGFFTSVFLEILLLFHSSQISSGWWEDWDQTVNWGKWQSDFHLFRLGSLVSVKVKGNFFWVDVTSGDFLVFAIVQDNITVFQQNSRSCGYFTVWCQERLQISLVDG